MATLQRAIELAIQAHRNDEDPPGEPYILHPMRVMLSLADDGDAEVRMVAILHDTVERGHLTLAALRDEGFSKDVVRGVSLMTHTGERSYAEYVIALRRHRLARLVKMADLRDNADLRHVDMRPGKFAKDRMRATRYILSYRFLSGTMNLKTYRRLMSVAEAGTK